MLPPWGCRGDHPRVCGEHLLHLQMIHVIAGSSPRMRGARQSKNCRYTSSGIIPAYAGSTTRTGPLTYQLTDHPRVCGEHSSYTYSIPSDIGSSPRMRGAQAAGVGPDGLDGIIPAYAGSTLVMLPPWGCRGDHPRVCGEHSVLCSPRRLRSGSSPRMRGATGTDGKPSDTAGSSPRMRGAHRVSYGVPRYQRIIPAYAGSTTARSCGRRPPWDHPRVCGEHTTERNILISGQGSSPRMRGAPTREYAEAHGRGIIPAYSGSTSGWIAVTYRLGDHPRVCGEHAALTLPLRR